MLPSLINCCVSSQRVCFHKSQTSVGYPKDGCDRSALAVLRSLTVHPTLAPQIGSSDHDSCSRSTSQALCWALKEERASGERECCFVGAEDGDKEGTPSMG